MVNEADSCHEHGCAAMILPRHPGRCTAWSQADHIPAQAEPAQLCVPKTIEKRAAERIIAGMAGCNLPRSARPPAHATRMPQFTMRSDL